MAPTQTTGFNEKSAFPGGTGLGRRDSRLNILLIEDNDEHAQIISRHIRNAERSLVNVVREGRLQLGLRRLAEGNFNVVLLDLRLPDSDIDATLAATLKASAGVPIVVLSSLEDRELALKAVHEGAQDYLFKASLSSELLIRAVYSAIERKQAEARIREQANQTKALFDLSQHALSEGKLDALMERVVRLILDSLGVEFSKILEFQPDRKHFLLKAGVGWNEGYVGHKLIPADLTTQAGYTLHASRPMIQGDLRSHEPIIVTNLEHESRFKGHSMLQEHGVTSGMSVIIYGKDEAHPYGVLGAHTKKERIFTRDEASFLQAIANTLAAAISRHELEGELQQRIEELHTAHRRKDEFLATLSHELRTPLNVIIGNLEIIKSSELGSKDFGDALAAIERGARDEAQLVSDTLEMSRIITGKMNLTMSELNFTEVIDGAVESVKFAAAAKNIRIDRRVSLEESATMVGDAGRLRQVAWNLLANAVKFTPEGGVITISASVEGDDLHFSVADTGKGISEENLPHVFERFWQEDSRINRRFMGLGLGLAIVRHVVESHGGTVRADSGGAGKGATFTVTLPMRPVVTSAPVAPARVAHVNIEATPTPTKNLEHDLKGLKLLLIDDSPDSLKLLSRLLEKKGASVTAIEDPFRGLERAESERFDVVISDIGMPGMSGYDLMKSLREWEQDRKREPEPAIALTAYVTTADAEKALASGFQKHLSKPINFSALIEAVADLVKSESEA